MNVEACTYVIFGAAGNLSRVKLMPAFYHLDEANKLPEGTKILALGRQDWTQEKWLTEVRDMIKSKTKEAFDETVFQRLSARLHYFAGDLQQPEYYKKTNKNTR